MHNTTTKKHPVTPEQQQVVDDGLRILARMIVRRHMENPTSREHHGDPREADPTVDGGA